MTKVAKEKHQYFANKLNVIFEREIVESNSKVLDTIKICDEPPEFRLKIRDLRQSTTVQKKIN